MFGFQLPDIRRPVEKMFSPSSNSEWSTVEDVGTTRFVPTSGVQLAQSNRFHYHGVTFSSQIKSKVGNILPKAAALRINLNIDGAPIASRSHAHPSESHSQTSRLLSSSLSLGVPVPHDGHPVYVRRVDPHLQLLVFHHTDTHI